jgi:hypothetical protein
MFYYFRIFLFYYINSVQYGHTGARSGITGKDWVNVYILLREHYVDI